MYNARNWMLQAIVGATWVFPAIEENAKTVAG